MLNSPFRDVLYKVGNLFFARKSRKSRENKLLLAVDFYRISCDYGEEKELVFLVFHELFVSFE